MSNDPRSMPVYSLLKDTTTTPGVTYLGQAIPGTATSAANWQISKIDGSGNITYGGAGAFNQIWNNRATTVVYS